jgi:CDP-diglyceride synthetase
VIALIVFGCLALLGSLMVVFVIPRFMYHGEDNPGEVRRFATKWTLVTLWVACGIGAAIGLLTESVLR